jgi:hypothetical protein
MTDLEAVRLWVCRQNFRVYEEKYRTREMHRMTKRCSELAERCLTRPLVAEIDVDAAYARYCQTLREKSWVHLKDT